MKYLQEITEWEVPNHIYYVSDDKSKVVGYIQNGNGSMFKFKVPMNFNVKGRKFIELKNIKAENDNVYFERQKSEKKTSNIVEVKGSNNKIYYVSKFSNNTYSCTCPGFTFRRTCKHIKNES